jgi:electron transport complex protein RnfB
MSPPNGPAKLGKIRSVSPPRSLSLAEEVDAALPQTQCRRCGYDGCRPYAEDIARGAAINRCPPGADELIATLAALTGRPAIALDLTCGEPGPLTVARIDEISCIGCTLCIEACPVDAIIGAAKRMHTVLPALCTGCELCVPPCPVDCIAMLPAGRAWSPEAARAARNRYVARNRRLARATASSRAIAPSASPDRERIMREAAVAAALARARVRRAAADRGTK